MKLYFYFARRFTSNVLGLFGIFLVLGLLIEMIEVLRKFDSASLRFLDVVALTALRIPAGVYAVFPLLILLATIFLYLGLAKSSELVVTRAAGRSALRALAAPVSVALVVGVVVVAVFNPIVTASSKQFKVLERQLNHGPETTLSLGPDGLWLRQGSDLGQTVIHAERATADGSELLNVTFYGFEADSKTSFRITAARAQLKSGYWLASTTKEWAFEVGQNSESLAISAPEIQIPTDLTTDQIRDGFGAPNTIAVWKLPAFIDRLENAGFSSQRHRIQLQTQIALPFLLVTMVLIGAIFTMRHTRFGNTGLMVLFAISMGFTLFFIRNFSAILGENGEIPVLLAAWAPPSAGILLALGLLLHLEDG